MADEKESWMTQAALEAAKQCEEIRKSFEKHGEIPFMKRKAPPPKRETGGY